MKNLSLLAVSGLIGIIMTAHQPVIAEDEVVQPSEQAQEDTINANQTWRKRWENMSEEEKEKFRAERDARWEKFRNMTPEERKAHWQERRQERMAKMTPEQREEYEAKYNERKEMMEKFKGMSPEEKKEFIEKRKQEKMAKMTPEQREAFQQRHDKMMERLKKYNSGEGGPKGSEKLPDENESVQEE